MEELIIVKQLPVIEENLKKISLEIDEKVERATSLICNEDTVKEVKKVRADLTAEFKELETQRKFVKEKVLAPYQAFEEVYKTYVSDKFKKADTDLKTKIDEIETEQKKQKSIEVSTYFQEYAKKCHLDWMIEEPKYFLMANINVTLSASLKSLKEQATQFIDKVVDDLKLIDTQANKEEILVEYRKDLNVSRAITEVSDRHFILEQVRKAEQEKECVQEQENKVVDKVEETLKAPEIIDGQMSIDDVPEEIIELNFRVRCTYFKAKELKNFLESGGYDYE